MLRLKNSQEKINIEGTVLLDEPMAKHTAFRVGGPADIYVVPASVDDAASVMSYARSEGLPYFVVGGGANIVVADAGIRGIVINTSALNTAGLTGDVVAVGAGLPISDASAWAADRGKSGLEFIYAMPGSVGGAVWMNARCYGSDIYAVLAYVDYLDERGEVQRYEPRPEDFGYKRSPFQDRQTMMTGVGFRLGEGDSRGLWSQMRDHENDRTRKGHFAAPCAGSVFKNNRSFGKPSGKIIDDAGLRGFQIGGAKISDLHANIIINAGDATAADIRDVIVHVEQTIKIEQGLELEREILFIGDWGER